MADLAPLPQALSLVTEARDALALLLSPRSPVEVPRDVGERLSPVLAKLNGAVGGPTDPT